MSTGIKSRIESPRSLTTQLSRWTEGWVFVVAMWLLSRLLIIVAIQLIAPLYPTDPTAHPQPQPLDFVPGFIPKTDWGLFSHWDGAWYKRVATSGYEYARDGKWHSIAFFPLFPLLIRGLMFFGLSYEVAGVLVNNLSFLGAMLLLYRWVEEKHGISAARWATALLAWCPFSIYGTVIYTEGLFLLLSTAALQAFEKGQYVRAAVWGALTTATRITGSMLVPTFLLVAWKERRPPIAYVAALISGVGLLAFIAYCAIRFGDPVAFVTVQKAWNNSPPGFINLEGWGDIFAGLFQVGFNGAERWAKVLMVFGGGFLLWYLRTQIRPIVVVYGFCSLALLLASGAVLSLGRHAFAIISLPFAMGIFISRYPRWGYAIIGLFVPLLVGFCMRFAWWRWVA